MVSINANTNFPNVPLGVCGSNIELALLSSLGGHVGFLGKIYRRVNMPTATVRNETRSVNRKRLHRHFSVTATETITQLSILYRCYVPCIGINKTFVTLGNSSNVRRLDSTRGTVGVLNNGIRLTGTCSLPSNSRHALVIVEGIGTAPGVCPQSGKGVGGSPLWTALFGEVFWMALSTFSNIFLFMTGGGAA